LKNNKTGWNRFLFRLFLFLPFCKIFWTEHYH
jgi:hypothetical protein